VPLWADTLAALRGAERWLLPAECRLCGRSVTAWPDDPLICPLCRSRWAPVPEPVCHRCGQPRDGDLECRICTDWPAGFFGVRSAVWLSGTARDAVHSLKYSGWWRAAQGMAPAMTRLEPLSADSVLVPIPLGSARRRERGYNQSAELAGALGRLVSLPVREDLLQRTRDTARQTGLAPDARRANLDGAFVGRAWGSRRPVLVDDVFTTGATLVSAAKALLAAGVHEVSAVTFARAVRPLEDV
jgi:ComF family protein